MYCSHYRHVKYMMFYTQMCMFGSLTLIHSHTHTHTHYLFNLQKWISTLSTHNHPSHLLYPVSYRYIPIIILTTHIRRLVIEETVFEHESKVFHTLLPAVVDIVFQLLLDSTHVHGMFYHCKVVLWQSVSRRLSINTL